MDVDTRHDEIERVAGWIAAAERIVVLTGAGISTDSGIPDFRGPNGVWTKNPAAEKMATIQHYLADPDLRRAAWRSRNENPAFGASPNTGHQAIVELERQGQAARRRHPERRRVAPEGRPGRGAGRRGPRHDLVDPLLGVPGPPADGRDAGPRRRRRGGPAVRGVRRDPEERHDLVRPGADPRGDRPSDAGQRGVRPAAGRRFDARRLPGRLCVPRAKKAGARVVIVNGDPTEMDGLADAVLNGQIGDILPQLIGS